MRKLPKNPRGLHGRALAGRGISGIFAGMSTLAEIEQAAGTLAPREQQELLLFLAAKLREKGAELPEPRLFAPEQLQGWMDEDEADLRRFDAGQ